MGSKRAINIVWIAPGSKTQKIKTFCCTLDLEKQTERKHEVMEPAVLRKRKGSFKVGGWSENQWEGNEAQVHYKSIANQDQLLLNPLRTAQQQSKEGEVSDLVQWAKHFFCLSVQKNYNSV